MAGFVHTPPYEIPQIRNDLKESFGQGITLPLRWRRNQLYQLAHMLQDNAELFSDALNADLGKPKQETWFAEVGPVIERALRTAEQIEEWTKHVPADSQDWQKPWSPTLHKTARGTVLIITPWNYPIVLSLQPLMGAIAAGCCAVIKPSDISPSNSQLFAKLFPKYMDPAAYRIVNGSVEVTTKLLELQWDYIFYIGNNNVGRIVATAAAKHVTPITLELGGKSAVIIDPSFDIGLAAKRVLWAKTTNAGQTCVAPDYVLVPREKQDQLVEALKEHCEGFFPEGALNSSSYGRIASTFHHNRLKSLLHRTRGKIAFGGKVDDKKGFEPTVVQDVDGDDALMQEEIFGPILAIVPIANVTDAIKFVNARPYGVALYAFTEDALLKQQMVETTSSGVIVFNDAFMQLTVAEIPLAGVGESGYGYHTPKLAFEAFTQLRGSIDMPKEAEAFLQIRYPPYTEESFKAITTSVNLEIPADA